MANRALAKGAWVVTGAASGIGQQFASYLARRGDAVAAWDRDATGLERTRELCAPGRLDSQQVDVSVAADVERAAAASRAALGPLAHVVHCAGILRMAPVEAMAVEDFRAMIDVNYLGSVHVAKALLPDLRTATSGGRAVLMFVASIAGLRAAPELEEGEPEAGRRGGDGHGARCSPSRDRGQGLWRIVRWTTRSTTQGTSRYAPARTRLRASTSTTSSSRASSALIAALTTTSGAIAGATR